MSEEAPTVWLGVDAGLPEAELSGALNEVVKSALAELPRIRERLIESPAAYRCEIRTSCR
jgi:hypothetical protein